MPLADRPTQNRQSQPAMPEAARQLATDSPALTNRQNLWRGLKALAAISAAACVCWIAWREVADVVSFKTIGLNYALLKAQVATNPTQALLLYVLAYAALGAFVLPGSALFVVVSGLLFGAVLGTVVAIAASTLAASLAFLGAGVACGSRLMPRSSPLFQRFRDGFAHHALGYMLFLRVTPGLPFALINVGPGLLGVPFRTFLVGTAIGVVPSRIALSTAGAGLAHAIDTQNISYSQCLAHNSGVAAACPYDIPLPSLLTNETLAAFVALAFLALVPALMDVAPAVWQRLKAR